MGKIEVVSQAIQAWVLKQPDVQSIESFVRLEKRITMFVRRKDGSYQNVIVEYFSNVATWEGVRGLLDAAEEGLLFSDDVRVVLVFDHPMAAEFSEAPLQTLRESVVSAKISVGLIQDDGSFVLTSY
ncbi:hypothetical protein BHS09_24140 [Myxococcus xanthus]|uniref:Uncharacterized protein n=2 Tax=Myxococcus xanthus TaxID=34 RepID=A0AAE6KU46_MYXXA|nr:hypothetical protein BHS09_24140 [Myxococcus xanthus]QDE77099.1 hypothetical protein BHS08_24165 [Myxococcus xanthus]